MIIYLLWLYMHGSLPSRLMFRFLFRGRRR